MSLSSRLSMIFKSRASSALDRAEDPRQTLDYSYERQLEMLQQVRRGVVDVATSRKRLELQIQQLQTSAERGQQQAAQALSAGREDLAREALTRRSGVQQQLLDLERQLQDLQAQEDKLVTAQQRLQTKVEQFRTRKETIKANYSAAEAQSRISEAVSGMGEEMGDVGLAVQRAEDKTAALQARAGAIDGLIASGALDDMTGSSGDTVQKELDRISSDSEVEAELARLKGSLGQGGSPSAVTAEPRKAIDIQTAETTEEVR